MRPPRRFCAIWLFIIAAAPAAPAQAQQSPGRRFFTVEIIDGSSFLSDGSGAYLNGVDSVVGSGNNGFALCTNSATCSTLPEVVPTTEAPRSVILDLARPVPGSGASDLGRVRSSAANFGAFWEQDTLTLANSGPAGELRPVIRSPLLIPVGATVQSQRVEIRFFNEGVQHILQFGPWTAGQYQSGQGEYHGRETTAGSITRVSESEWLIRSGPDSVGRLWNNADPDAPTDLGLYRFSFQVRYIAM